MADLAAFYNDPVLSLSTSRNLCVAVWRNAPSLASLDRLGELFDREKPRHPSGIGFANLITAGEPRFADGVRERASQVMARGSEGALGMTHIVMLPGLKGAAARGFLSTVFLLSRTTTPVKVFGAIDDATAWLSLCMNGTDRPSWTPAQLSEVVRQAGSGSK